MRYVDYGIAKIKQETLELHRIAKESVKLCFRAMKDKSFVKEISKLEERSDELEARIHDDCSHFIIRFQPMAKDVRFALGIMRISSSYERIVDLAQEIALYECEMRETIFKAEKPLLAMFDVVERGFDDAENLRDEMISLDNLVDEIYINALEEIEKDFRCVEEVMAIRNIERMGDLLCKIATRFVYIHKGKWVWIK